MSAPARALLFAWLLLLAGACSSDSEEPVAEDRQNAEAAAWTSQKDAFLEIATRLKEGSNPYLGSAKRKALEAYLKGPGITDVQRANAQSQLAWELLRLGEVDEAVATIDAAWSFIERSASVERNLGLLKLRALVYLRKAEVENCIARHNPDCCIFPLEGQGVHGVPEPAAKALSMLDTILASSPDDLQSRWSYNILAMAIGTYPEGVPEAVLIPPAAFESEYDIGRFSDVAPKLGVDTFSLCGGCIVEDFDGDGFLDIVASTFDPAGPMVYYRNDGEGGFDDASSTSRLDDQLGGLNCVPADYDNDGDADILVLRGAWLHDAGGIRNSLLQNDGGGVFTDVSREAGLADPAWPTQAAAWADFDNDGWLDLVIGNESLDPESGAVRPLPAQLFHNNGDGTFTDQAREAGLTTNRFCKGVTTGDYDNDGFVDIYFSCIGPNQLYRNGGDGRFTDVASQAGVTEPSFRSFASWFYDHDNDGWLDLFVVAFDAGVDDLAANYLGLEDDATRPRMYRNQRDGTFTDIAADLGLDRPLLPMGANFGDLDNDGWLDVFLTTGDPHYRTLMPNVMLRNDRGLRFQDVTQSGGFGHLQKGHGVAFADLDNDGDQDVYHELGGFFPGDGFANALFLNPGHGHNSIVLELEGTRTNRSGFGARIKVVTHVDGETREIHRAVGSVSSFGGSPVRQEIGLGSATGVASLEVWWPVSGTRQRFTDLPVNARFLIKEDSEAPEQRPLERTSFE